LLFCLGSDQEIEPEMSKRRSQAESIQRCKRRSNAEDSNFPGFALVAQHSVDEPVRELVQNHKFVFFTTDGVTRRRAWDISTQMDLKLGYDAFDFEQERGNCCLVFANSDNQHFDLKHDHAEPEKHKCQRYCRPDCDVRAYDRHRQDWALHLTQDFDVYEFERLSCQVRHQCHAQKSWRDPVDVLAYCVHEDGHFVFMDSSLTVNVLEPGKIPVKLCEFTRLFTMDLAQFKCKSFLSTFVSLVVFGPKPDPKKNPDTFATWIALDCVGGITDLYYCENENVKSVSCINGQVRKLFMVGNRAAVWTDERELWFVLPDGTSKQQLLLDPIKNNVTAVGGGKDDLLVAVQERDLSSRILVLKPLLKK